MWLLLPSWALPHKFHRSSKWQYRDEHLRQLPASNFEAGHTCVESIAWGLSKLLFLKCYGQSRSLKRVMHRS